jgi:hypothetical protein
MARFFRRRPNGSRTAMRYNPTIGNVQPTHREASKIDGAWYLVEIGNHPLVGISREAAEDSGGSFYSTQMTVKEV